MSMPIKENKNLALVSVIIPVFNAEKYIEETINSVIAQTYPHIELIVVNDGSTDGSKALLEAYGDKLSLYSIKNQGVSFARNLAIKHAQGEWIAFIDADDIWSPDKLSEQLKSLGGCEWSHTDSYYIGDGQSGLTKRSDLSCQVGGMIFDDLVVENFITTSTVLIKQSLFLSQGGFDEDMEALEDWKLWLTLSKDHKLSFCSRPLAQYRVYDGSTSRKARKMLPIHEGLINQVFEGEVSQRMRLLRIKSLESSYMICSYIAEDSKDYSFSLVASLKAWRIEPMNISGIRRVAVCLLNYLGLVRR
jgi:glycosyltransferase involved in cell wall biosynthesis